MRWADLQSQSPPNFLYVSGKPGRYNMVGAECLYVSENQETARLEYEETLDPALERKQPVVEFQAEVNLTACLDLLDNQVLQTLGLYTADPEDPDTHNINFVAWRKHQPVATQFLGLAIVHLATISAIRYPSVAALRRGHSGANVVLYKRCVRSPDSVVIIGPDGPLQRWP